MTNSDVLTLRRPVESRDPNTGELWRRYEHASPQTVTTAVAAARRAQREWAARPLAVRTRALKRIRTAAFERREELARVLESETGKPPFEAMFEVLLIADTAAWAAREGPALLRPHREQSWHIATLRKWMETRWEPFGVVAVITPWNYPYLLTCGSLLPALLAGNAVILKPSEMTPSCTAALVEVVRAAGVPDDVVQWLPGDAEVGQTLIGAGIDRLFFTGSENAGRAVAARCGELLIPCSLELGGSDAAIVLDDCDPAAAARGIVWGRFSNAGQTCTAPKRVFVLDAVHDRFVDEVSRAVSSLRAGSGSDREVSPLIHARQARTFREQRADALEMGARVIARVEPQSTSESAVACEALVDVDSAMRVMQEETFGPILPIVRVANVDEAILQANATRFGLSASVWSTNRRRALSVARRLEAGTVMINDAVAEAAMTDVPHGGAKRSGNGRLHGAIGFRESVWPKTVVVDRFARWRQVWSFPYTSRMHEGLNAFFHFLHGPGVFRRMWNGLRATRLLYFGR